MQVQIIKMCPAFIFPFHLRLTSLTYGTWCWYYIYFKMHWHHCHSCSSVFLTRVMIYDFIFLFIYFILPTVWQSCCLPKPIPSWTLPQMNLYQYYFRLFCMGLAINQAVRIAAISRQWINVGGWFFFLKYINASLLWNMQCRAFPVGVTKLQK